MVAYTDWSHGIGHDVAQQDAASGAHSQAARGVLVLFTDRISCGRPGQVNQPNTPMAMNVLHPVPARPAARSTTRCETPGTSAIHITMASQTP